MTCNTIDLLNTLGKKWDATILEEISLNDSINFDKLLSINPKSYPKTLSKTLKDLAEKDLISKELFYEDKVKKSKYKITQKGIELLKAFESFKSINCADKVSTIKPCGECELGPNKT